MSVMRGIVQKGFPASLDVAVLRSLRMEGRRVDKRTRQASLPSFLYRVKYMVVKHARPPMALEIGSARNTP